jgi:hypothetical protein
MRHPNIVRMHNQQLRLTAKSKPLRNRRLILCKRCRRRAEKSKTQLTVRASFNPPHLNCSACGHASRPQADAHCCTLACHYATATIVLRLMSM